MRCLLLLLTVLAACEHEPPPKKAPPAVPTPPPPIDPANAQPPANPTPTPPPPTPPANANPPPVDAAIDAPPPVSQDCVDIAAHIADTMIAESKDPQQKAFIEQDKTKIIRRTAEACTRDSWKPEVLACFRKATKMEQMQICAKDLAAPAADTAQGP
ncbi:MAG: hypothetical protein H0T46_07600 [Deltaproteobacteria bacterium]|nr:hypothetical protein [Deltaproteobacteria bacterium]